jgi:hypothetical protein
MPINPKRNKMSKQWKIAAANLGLRMYTRLGGNFKDKAHFQPEQVFERIVIFPPAPSAT